LRAVSFKAEANEKNISESENVHSELYSMTRQIGLVKIFVLFKLFYYDLMLILWSDLVFWAMYCMFSKYMHTVSSFDVRTAWRLCSTSIMAYVEKTVC